MYCVCVSVPATPGRLVDHLENTKGFKVDNLKFLVCLLVIVISLLSLASINIYFY